MNIGWILLIVLVVLVLVVIATYNGLITLNNRVKEAASDIDVQLKRRYELIPNLQATVKGMFKEEKEIFGQITDARAGLTKGTMAEKLAANEQLTGALKSLFMLSESNPQLVSSDAMKELQMNLTDSQDKIMAAQRFYNANVRDFNTKIQIFPTNLYAKQLGFSAYEMIEATDGEKQNVKVEF